MKIYAPRYVSRYASKCSNAAAALLLGKTQRLCCDSTGLIASGHGDRQLLQLSHLWNHMQQWIVLG